MNDPIDVLLITATPTETKNLLAVFNVVTGRVAESVPGDTATYRDFGRVRGARVMGVQQTEMGTGVPGGSLDTLKDVVRELRPDAVIMVGIAYGLKPESQKIGDILVAKQMHQYEPQKVGATRLVPRGDKAHASTRLLARLNNAALEWSKATVEFGLILSGEKLADNREFVAELLTREPEAIGGEMEGGGLYVACQSTKTDWAFVKGICDWGYDKGEDKAARQQLAAENAASFVWYTLDHMPWNRLASS